MVARGLGGFQSVVCLLRFSEGIPPHYVVDRTLWVVFMVLLCSCQGILSGFSALLCSG